MEYQQLQPTATSPGPSWPKILISLVVLIALVVGYGVLAKNYSWWPHEVAVSPTPSTSDVDMTNWQTYRNEKYGFDFQMPADWKENSRGPDVLISGDEKDSIVFQLIDIDGLNHASQKLIMEGGDLDYFMQRTKDMCGETDACGEFVVGDSEEGDWNFTVHYDLDLNEYHYVFRRPTAHEYVEFWSSTISPKLFDQILSTFRFVEPTADTSTWQTYQNEKYGFEFQYSWDWNLVEVSNSNSLATLRWEASSNLQDKIDVSLRTVDDVTQRCAPYPGTTERVPWGEVPLPSGFWKFCQEDGLGVFNPSISLYVPQLQKYLTLTGGKQPTEHTPPRAGYGIDQGSYTIITIARTLQFTNSHATTNWQTYRNEKFGFKFQYPERFQTSSRLPEGTLLQFEDPQQAEFDYREFIAISLLDNPQKLSIRAWSETQDHFNFNPESERGRAFFDRIGANDVIVIPPYEGATLYYLAFGDKVIEVAMILGEEEYNKVIASFKAID